MVLSSAVKFRMSSGRCNEAKLKQLQIIRCLWSRHPHAFQSWQTVSSQPLSCSDISSLPVLLAARINLTGFFILSFLLSSEPQSEKVQWDDSLSFLHWDNFQTPGEKIGQGEGKDTPKPFLSITSWNMQDWKISLKFCSSLKEILKANSLLRSFLRTGRQNNLWNSGWHHFKHILLLDSITNTLLIPSIDFKGRFVFPHIRQGHLRFVKKEDKEADDYCCFSLWSECNVLNSDFPCCLDYVAL